jgi:hypothetical protein
MQGVCANPLLVELVKTNRLDLWNVGDSALLVQAIRLVATHLLNQAVLCVAGFIIDQALNRLS